MSLPLATARPCGHDQRELLIEQAQSAAAKASLKLLSAFCIFKVSSQAGVQAGAITASRPRISSLPTSVLKTLVDAPTSLGFEGLDLSQIREATTSAGTHIYVMPSAWDSATVLAKG